LIQFPCPQCCTVLRVPDDKAGKKGKCPKCGGVIAVPAATLEPEPEVVEAPQPAPAPQAATGKACPLCDAPGLAANATECPHCGMNLLTGLPIEGASAAVYREADRPKGVWGFFRAHLVPVVALGVIVLAFVLYFALLWPVRSEASAIEDALETRGLKDVDVEIPAFTFSMPEKVRVTATAKTNALRKSLGGAVEGWYYTKTCRAVLSGQVGETGANYLNPNQTTGRLKMTIHLGKKPG